MIRGHGVGKKPLHDAGHWRGVWFAAKDNMPYRCSRKKIKQWLKADRPVPIGEFIKGQAKGIMEMRNNVVFELNIDEKINLYGQHMALTYVMGYKLTKNSKTPGRPANEWIRSSIERGNEPRDPAKRKLLLALASPHGRELAIQKLTELGIIHRYDLTVQ